MPAASATTSRGLALLLALLTAAGPARPATASLKGWRDGPARMLLTDDEYRRFGSLSDDVERGEFVERFWSNLEVLPGTSPSEFRRSFETRSEGANARFGAPGSEGWRTDRGHVFLALGEPSRIAHESGGIDLLDDEVWTYDAVGPNARSVRIVFHHCRDGSYRLDDECESVRDPTSVSVDWERANYLRALRLNDRSIYSNRLQTMTDSLLSPLPGGLPVAKPSSGPARDRLSTDAPPAPDPEPLAGAQALDHSAYFFRAQDGSVLTLLAVAMEGGQAGAGAETATKTAAPFAAVSLQETGRRGESLPGAVRTLTLDPLPAPEAPGFFFGRAYLDAGRTYAARFAVRSPSQDQVIVRNARIGVPDLNAGFSVSSLVPAERFGPAGPDAGTFQVGSEEVVPKAGAVFHRSELLRLYLQVYGAAIDPATSMPRVDVEYRFFRVVRKGTKRHGKPFSVRGAAGAAMGLALPIGDWPVGAYRVVVELRDRVSGERVSVERTFAIAEG
ncbi:MAG TPA: GWxTD domain-containing protein [Candidatus Polarisedimenticolaceae bacterium]|nr:GWxTD domain-containing protein [Candidatus Polarisedimenticolaceae bacterium]